MTPKPKEIVVPRDKAVFWLDKNGFWHNRHGRFEHPKISAYFHSCIRRDADGYFLYQVRDDCVEKVYFPYEDTALFVFDIQGKDPLMLVLNTGRQIPLNPEHLYVRSDNLYLQAGRERIKFSERALMKISDLLDDRHGQLRLRLGGRDYAIPQQSG